MRRILVKTKFGEITVKEAYAKLKPSVPYHLFKNRIYSLGWDVDKAASTEIMPRGNSNEVRTSKTQVKNRRAVNKGKYIMQKNGVEIRNDCMGKEVTSPLYESSVNG